MAIDFIPNKFYVTRQPRNAHTPDEVLGFMQPMHSAGFAKRKETADNWAGRNKLDPIEVENKPLSGFSMTENKRRYMNKNVIWRVLHPLGFEFEITSDNFSDFLMEIDMKQGIIQTPMMFVRRSGENYLTYEGSAAHKKAVTQAQMETNVSTTKLQPGDVVTLKNGDTNKVYLGAWHTLSLPEIRYGTKVVPDYTPANIKSKRHHYFIDSTINEVTGKREISKYVYSYSSANVNSIDETGFITEDECNAYFIEKMDSSTYEPPVAYDKKPMRMDKMQAILTEIPLATGTSGPVLDNRSYYDDYSTLVELADGSCGFYAHHLQGYHNSRSDAHKFYKVIETPIGNDTIMYNCEVTPTRKSYGRKCFEKTERYVQRDDIVKAYKIAYTRV